MGTIWLLRRPGIPAVFSLNNWVFLRTGLYYLWRFCGAGLWPDLHRRLCWRPSVRTKRTLVAGAIVLAIGYFMTGMSLLNPDLIFIALGTIAVGNGLFKANPASLLSKCYQPKDPRLDGAFTLFYMSINIGSLLSLSLAR